MRVVVIGATGNLGTSAVQALSAAPEVTEVVGVARRLPQLRYEKTHFVSADVTRDDLEPIVAGADAVIHLAWRLQPAHDPTTLHENNVRGSRRCFEACGRARVGALIVASSIAAYAYGPKDRRVDESWPLGGTPDSLFSKQKVDVERQLDALAPRIPDTRIVRMRPVPSFKREAASEIERLFIGPLVPSSMFDRRFMRVVPSHHRLVWQCVHTGDVGRAFAAAVTREVSGAFNLAAEPVLDPERLTELFHARKLPVKKETLRKLVAWSWRLRMQPTDPGWVDVTFDAPVVDVTRAKRELSWEPRHGAEETLIDLLEGLKSKAGIDTPPLTRRGQRESAVTEGTRDAGHPRSPLPLQ